MKLYVRHKTALMVLSFLLILPAAAYAGVPYVGNVMLTDVTARSFSVIWTSSEAGWPGLNVYDDADGLIPTADTVITLQPLKSGNNAIGEMAEDNGVMKTKVAGLKPDATYYFQTVTTSKTTSEVTCYPATAPLLSVSTESLVVRTKMCADAEVPFANDLIAVECYLPDGSTPAEGTLLVATVEGCGYPVSQFVGDGAPVPEACVDLNNFFSLQGFETKPLYGGETLTLTRFMGVHGIETSEYFVPANRQLAEIKPPLFIPPCEGDFDGDGNVDGSDLAVFAAEFGRTDCACDCKGDFDEDGDVDGSDLGVFAADFGRTDCPD
jgi:hypothetical protein